MGKKHNRLASLICGIVTQSLIEEVNTTPKPGLVDLSNNGSHRDMTPETFYISAKALELFWGRCFLTGGNCRGQKPAECFELLRREGRYAEKIMLKATNGVNTHKGAIFTIGTVCGAIGRLYEQGSLFWDPASIAKECAGLCSSAVENDFRSMATHDTISTTGERLYLDFGLRGIRGELADGLPGVTTVSLPCFEKALKEGKNRNDAGVYALIHLIARGTDTNMIARGGIDKAEKASGKARKLCEREELSLADVKALDRDFIQDNLSPGGCADLLAVTYFLHDWKTAIEKMMII